MDVEAPNRSQSRALPAAARQARYRELAGSLTALFEGERDAVANAANLCAELFHSLPALNWAGFYFLKNGGLVLGPFQGRSACVRIALGRGVCGTAAERRTTVIVPDVHEFPGHIACDSASRSEIVVPLLDGGRVLGVLDLDSPEPGTFDAQDAAGLESIVRIWLAASDLSSLIREAEGG